MRGLLILNLALLIIMVEEDNSGRSLNTQPSSCMKIMPNEIMNLPENPNPDFQPDITGKSNQTAKLWFLVQTMPLSESAIVNVSMKIDPVIVCIYSDSIFHKEPVIDLYECGSGKSLNRVYQLDKGYSERKH